MMSYCSQCVTFARACARNKVWFMHSSEYGKLASRARAWVGVFYKVPADSFPYLFLHSLGLLFISERCRCASCRFVLRLIVLPAARVLRLIDRLVHAFSLLASISVHLRFFLRFTYLVTIPTLDHPLVTAINPLACNILVVFLLFSGIIAAVTRLACTLLAALLWPVYFLISFTYYRSYFARLLCVYYAPWLRRWR